MTIREALARKLAVIRDTEEDWALYVSIADECLRQMEYVRRNPSITVINSAIGTVPDHIVEYGDMSLAPDGWQP